MHLEEDEPLKNSNKPHTSSSVDEEKSLS